MSEPVFLTESQVETLHRLALEHYGGQAGTRDISALKSAVVQPQNVWLYTGADLFDVAAAYAFHLAESQAFIDGNKRAGIAAALTFLRLNGRTVPRHTDELYAAMIAMAERRLDKPGLASLLRRISGSE
jgi:death-on-curing protein